MKLTDIMSDSEVPRFFKRATGRDYGEKETCINDIRRLLMCFLREHAQRDNEKWRERKW